MKLKSDFSCGPSRLRLFGALLGVLAALSCGDSASDPDPGENGNAPPDANTITRSMVLQSLAQRVYEPAAQDFATQAQALTAAVDTLAAGIADGTVDEAMWEAARAAWRDAMLSWEQLELMQLGPAGNSEHMAGGVDLRAEVYSWTTVNPCRVDTELVEAVWDQSDFFENERVNVYGLDALEYLLHHPVTDNACPPQLPVNGQWGALSAEEINRLRGGYAKAVAAQVAADAARLRDAWDPANGNFVAALAQPGEGDSPYDNDRHALDQAFAAAYYLELQVKDLKLSKPVGLHQQCTSEICPEDLEFQWSPISLAAITANLEAFQRIFHGGAPDDADAVGFDDLLRGLGADALADRMTANIVAAIDQTSRTEVDMRVLLQTDVTASRAIHAAVKTVTDDLKSEFVSVLNLTIPKEGKTDTD